MNFILMLFSQTDYFGASEDLDRRAFRSSTRQQDAPSHIETSAPPLTRPGPMRGRQPTCYLRQGYGDACPYYSE